jgi:hypothetical protein
VTEQLYDVMTWSDRHGWETVLRAVSLAAAEGYERRYLAGKPGGHVSICVTLWADTPEEYRP